MESFDKHIPVFSKNGSLRSGGSLFRISKWLLWFVLSLLMLGNCTGTSSPTGQPTRQPSSQPTIAPSSVRQCSVGGYVASGVCSLVPAGNNNNTVTIT